MNSIVILLFIDRARRTGGGLDAVSGRLATMVTLPLWLGV